MKKTTVIALILLPLLGLGLVRIQSVTAQNQDNITINADGSITPSTAPIQQTGSVYSLISDIDGSIMVQANNVIFDGSGYAASSVSLHGTSNVTIKNFIVMMDEFSETIGILLNSTSNNLIFNNTVKGFWSVQAINGIDFGGIYIIDGKSNIISKNSVSDNLVGMNFINTSYNLITENTITSNSPYTSLIHFVNSPNNTIYHNNFVSSASHARVYNSVNSWDNGFPSGGNYWSDYQTKFPDAGEAVDSGIGDMPYVIDAQNKDNYPLMKPFSSTQQPEVSPTPVGSTASVPENSPLGVMVFGVLLVAIAVFAAIGVVVYYKRRRR